MPIAKPISLNQKKDPEFFITNPHVAFAESLGIFRSAYEAFVLAGSMGLTMYELAERLGESYYYARRHVKHLISVGLVEADDQKRKGAQVYSTDIYHSHNKAMMLPNVDPKKERIPAVELLQAANTTPVGDTNLSKHSMRFGYYLGSLARYAYEWKTSPEKVSPDEVPDLRKQMKDAIKWHTWYIKVLEELLYTKELWNQDDAYDAWYSDSYSNIDPEDMYKILTNILNQLRQSD